MSEKKPKTVIMEVNLPVDAFASLKIFAKAINEKDLGVALSMAAGTGISVAFQKESVLKALIDSIKSGGSIGFVCPIPEYLQDYADKVFKELTGQGLDDRDVTLRTLLGEIDAPVN